MQRFPQCLFKPGDKPMAGLLLDSIMVRDEQELAEALAQGWFESAEAADASRSVPSPVAEVASKSNRAELERQATLLNIPFSPRTSDKKLAAEIAAKRTTAEA